MGDRLKDKVVVVTGAASGIGAGTAERFVDEGAKVVLTDIQEGPGAALSEKLGGNTRFIKTNVTVESEVAAAVDLAVSEFGRLDCMINNAGIVGAVGPINETPLEAWDATLGVLLTGTFLGAKHAARVMIPQKSGNILSISSTAGFAGGLGPHAYTAAKHAVIGLTKSISSELNQHGIRANAVAPGNTATAMTADVITGDPDSLGGAEDAIASMSPLGIAGVPSDIANALLYLASDEARYVSGHCLLVDSGQLAGGTPAQFSTAEPGLIREAGGRG